MKAEEVDGTTRLPNNLDRLKTRTDANLPKERSDFASFAGPGLSWWHAYSLSKMAHMHIAFPALFWLQADLGRIFVLDRVVKEVDSRRGTQTCTYDSIISYAAPFPHQRVPFQTCYQYVSETGHLCDMGSILKADWVKRQLRVDQVPVSRRREVKNSRQDQWKKIRMFSDNKLAGRKTDSGRSTYFQGKMTRIFLLLPQY